MKLRNFVALAALVLLGAALFVPVAVEGQGRGAIRFPAITNSTYGDGNGNSDWVVVDATAGTVFTLQTKKSGTISGCSIHLQGTVLSRDDNPVDADAFSLSGAQTCTSNIMVHVTSRPVKMIRIHVDSFSGSSTPSVTPYVYR